MRSTLFFRHVLPAFVLGLLVAWACLPEIEGTASAQDAGPQSGVTFEVIDITCGAEPGDVVATLANVDQVVHISGLGPYVDNEAMHLSLSPVLAPASGELIVAECSRPGMRLRLLVGRAGA